jgi:AcrR family transcriptional regulator
VHAPAESRRRRLSAAARRQTILDAATPVFISAGYEQTRMADIARRVGVTEPVVFQNFGTKAALFAAVLEHVAWQAAEHLRRLSEHAGDTLAWLAQLLSPEHQDRLHTAPMFGVLFAEAHRLHADETVEAAYQRAVHVLADAAAEILGAAQAKGSIRDDVPPATLAWLLISLIQARQFRRAHSSKRSAALEADLLAALLSVLRPRHVAP